MQGHVRKRGNKWCAVVYLGIGENGKRKYKWFSGYDTKKEAQRALNERVREITLGTYVEPSKILLRDFAEIWFKSRSSQVRRTTLDGNQRLIRKHIIPRLGNLPLSQLRGHHINALYAELQDSLLPGSVKTIHNILHIMVKDAMKWEYLALDVMKQVTPPRVPRTTKTSWGFEDVQKFQSAIQNHPFATAFILATTTGLRRGEILGLRWEDVDLEHGTLHIRQSVKIEGSAVVLSDVKTKSSRRSVKLFDDDVERLREHRKQQLKLRLLQGPEFNPENLVFVNQKGTVIRPTYFSQAWSRFLRSIDLPHIPLHGTRHTHASLLLALGVHPKVVQERLGHASIRTTMDLYSHVLPGMQEVAVAKLEERLSKTSD